MKNKCPYIPGFILDDYLPNWNIPDKSLIEFAYLIFNLETKEPIMFNCKHIIYNKTRQENGKPFIFEHLTTKNNETKNIREFDLERTRRLKWVFYILQNCNCSCPDYLLWKQKDRATIRTKILCNKEDYIIILEDRKEHYFLVTAYYIDIPHTKERYIKSYNKYKKAASHT